MGLMRIDFNKLMHTSFNWTTLNQSNIDIWLEPVDDWHNYTENFDMNLLNLTWNITDYNAS